VGHGVVGGFAGGVGIADDIEPETAPFFAVGGGGEETVDEFGEGVWGWVGEEGVGFGWGGREAGEVVGGAAEEGARGGWGRELETVGGGFGEEEAVGVGGGGGDCWRSGI
jgi:hypothetical protein